MRRYYRYNRYHTWNNSVHLRKMLGCFNYMCRAFPQPTMEKLKVGIFNSPQIRQLIKDTEIQNFMNTLKCTVWNQFSQVLDNFPENVKTAHHCLFISSRIVVFRHLACSINIKIHFCSHKYRRFQKNLVRVTSRENVSISPCSILRRGTIWRWDAVMIVD